MNTVPAVPPVAPEKFELVVTFPVLESNSPIRNEVSCAVGAAVVRMLSDTEMLSPAFSVVLVKYRCRLKGKVPPVVASEFPLMPVATLGRSRRWSGCWQWCWKAPSSSHWLFLHPRPRRSGHWCPTRTALVKSSETKTALLAGRAANESKAKVGSTGDLRVRTGWPWRHFKVGVFNFMTVSARGF